MDVTFIQDEHLINPENDLLGIRTYAERLARFLIRQPPPFTVGIYGAWGEGKTTFVEFIHEYLDDLSQDDEPVIFVSFSAWPYTSSDEMWRALVMRIMDKLYEDELKQAEYEWNAEQIRTTDLEHAAKHNQFDSLIRLLQKDAIKLKLEPVVDDGLDDYRKIMHLLDLTPTGAISKDRQQQLQIDQEQALIGAAKVLGASLASLSPLAATLQKVIGLDTNISIEEMFTVERNQAVRQGVRSLIQFQEEIHSVLKKKTTISNSFSRKQFQTVYVFIDDLDRCLPDIALEILEAVKLFFSAPNIVFLVAADKTLIGKGLQLRYRNLGDVGGFEKKGDEYFEKIIQFGIKIPPRSKKQTHSFIAAQFPQWMPATDIIEAAVGSNPRKLKQYGNQLIYEYDVMLQLRQS